MYDYVSFSITPKRFKFKNRGYHLPAPESKSEANDENLLLTAQPSDCQQLSLISVSCYEKLFKSKYQNHELSIINLFNHSNVHARQLLQNYMKLNNLIFLSPILIVTKKFTKQKNNQKSLKANTNHEINFFYSVEFEYLVSQSQCLQIFGQNCDFEINFYSVNLANNKIRCTNINSHVKILEKDLNLLNLRNGLIFESKVRGAHLVIIGPKNINTNENIELEERHTAKFVQKFLYMMPKPEHLFQIAIFTLKKRDEGKIMIFIKLYPIYLVIFFLNTIQLKILLISRVGTWPLNFENLRNA